MNRQNRSQMAQETLTILQSGQYSVPTGSVVSIGQSLDAACAGTVLYLPTDHAGLAAQCEALPRVESTIVSVTNRTTLAAGKALAEKYQRVACLNFASAKNPGGGFLSGSQAQEESLARSSGLYSTLQMQPQFYDYHRACGTCIYSDRAIYSPQVPVFRDDDGQLLPVPWMSDFITAAAVNAGAVRRNEPEHERDIVPIMEQRTRMVLSIAILQGCEALVLGAWGCGVFQNDPATIAGVFSCVLQEEPFQNRFAHLEFAVYDPKEAQLTFQAFQKQLNPA